MQHIFKGIAKAIAAKIAKPRLQLCCAELTKGKSVRESRVFSPDYNS